jgi:hypothetical protein
MKREELSQEECKLIKKEINNKISELIRGCEQLNMELAFSIFDNSDDFLMIGTDGTQVKYNNYISSNVEYLQTCEKFGLSTKNKEIRIIDRDTVIYSWSFSAEALLKSGERDTIEGAGASFIFRRKNNQWKVIYYHESSSPVKKQKQ